MGSSVIRTFGGEKYRLKTTARSKGALQDYADRRRREGKKARVVKHGSGYAVFVRG